MLGQLYYQGGRGVAVNHEMAHHYFVIAAESGSANAYAYLGKVRLGFVVMDVLVYILLKTGFCSVSLMHHQHH